MCVTWALNNTLTILHSYDTLKNNPYYDICEILKAMRATSAVFTFFLEIYLERHNKVFVDSELS